MTASETKQIQRALREILVPNITVDGVAGEQTTKAIASFAQLQGLDVTAATALLVKYAHQRYVSDDAFAQAAALLSVKESYVRAIAEVESAGESFLKDGRVKILFERHWFYKKLKDVLTNSISARARTAGKLGVTTQNATELLALVVKQYDNICNTATGGYKGGEAEWDRLNLAMDFDIEAACQSASYGGYQIMGFNCIAAGFDTAKDMLVEMAASESVQFLALSKFIKANPAMHNALKRTDWAGFAAAYNGPGFAVNHYDSKLKAGEAKWAAVV